jgi:hypothetical protein
MPESHEGGKPSAATRVLAFVHEEEVVVPMMIERYFGLSRTHVARCLAALRHVGLAQRGKRTREGFIWTLTAEGKRVAGEWKARSDA